MPTLEHSLICPNQMRNHGIQVHDCPRSLAPASAPSIHSIVVDEFDLVIPLIMVGIISYFPTRLPTGKEIDLCTHINLTITVRWDPHSDVYEKDEHRAQMRVRTEREIS